MVPLASRSTQRSGSPAISISVDCPSNARVAIHASPCASIATRLGSAAPVA